MKKVMIPCIIIILLIVGVILFMLFNKNYQDDTNTLYSIKFGNTKLRFERYDYSLGQNQIVGVEKSTNNGKTYEKITKDTITVSMEPKFVFLNKKLGFAVKKSNNTKDNGKYYGMYVTNDGGKTFKLSEINYDNPNIEILTIEDVPYIEKDILKLPCSIYQVKKDQSGYEDLKIIFKSTDNGLTWDLDDSESISLSVIDESITSTSAKFIMKNYSKSYSFEYGNPYYIEINKDGKWKKLETVNDLFFTMPAFTLKPDDEKEFNIDWEYGYGKLEAGSYRLVKDAVRVRDNSIKESDKIYLYAEFIIK